MTNAPHPRTPVLVAGEALNQRCPDPGAALDAESLMALAARRALGTPWGRGLRRHIGWVGMPQGSAPESNTADGVRRRLGIGPARTVLAEIGVLQQTLITRACQEILSGRVDAALLVGGEARYRAVSAARAGITLRRETAADSAPDEILRPQGDISLAAEERAGLERAKANGAGATAYYAILESSLRAASGLSPRERLRQIGARYARFSEIASRNPRAVRRTPLTPDDITVASASNPCLAHPYTKFMVTTWTVDQAGALVLCTLELARQLGVPRSHMLFPVAAAHNDDIVPVSARRSLHQAGLPRVLAAALESRTGRRPVEADLVDIYSCFPVAVQSVADELGFGAETDVTVTGGMAFAGGPLNNYTFQALAAVHAATREGRGDSALVTGVSGLMTKLSLGWWSTEPPAAPYDDAICSSVNSGSPKPVLTAITGPGSLVGYTVVTGADGADLAITVVESAAGSERAVLTTHCAATVHALRTGDLVGAPVVCENSTFRLPRGNGIP